MTKIEFFEAVLEGTVTEEMIEYAEAALKKDAERKAKVSQKRNEKWLAENESLIGEILGLLGEGAMTHAEIVEATGATGGKVTAVIRKLNAAGTIKAVFDAETGAKSYTLAD